VLLAVGRCVEQNRDAPLALVGMRERQDPGALIKFAEAVGKSNQCSPEMHKAELAHS
jgi:hypothetical protein